MFDTKQTNNNNPQQSVGAVGATQNNQKIDTVPDEVLHAQGQSPVEQVKKADVDDLNDGKDFPFKKIDPSVGPASQAVSPDMQSGAQEPEDIFASTDGAVPVANQQMPDNMLAGDGQKMPADLPDQLAAQSNLPHQRKGNMLFVIIIIVLSFIFLGLLGYWYWSSKMKDKDPVNNNQSGSSFQELEKEKDLDDILSDLGDDIDKIEDNDKDIENNDYESDFQDLERELEVSDQEKKVEEVDSDGDGLTDEEEMIYGTNPNRVDSDFDGLDDQEEVEQYGTDPNMSDTDGDSYPDGLEIENGYDPMGPGKLL